MAIISLTGKLQSGKDLTGKIIQYLTSNVKFPEDYSIESKLNNFGTSSSSHVTPWEIKKFATKLKMVASLILGVPVEKFEDNEYKDSYLGPEWESYGYANGFNHEYRNGEKMKTVMNVAFCDKERYEIEKRVNWQTAYHSKMTVREFLQRLGTEAVRNGLHQNAWVNALFADYTGPMATILHDDCPVHYSGPIGGFEITEEAEANHSHVGILYPNWIITDTRFPNEFDAIRKHQGLCIKIHRPIYLRLSKLYECYSFGNNSDIEFMNWLKHYDPKEYAKYNHISETAWESHEFDYTLINNCNLETYVERVKEMLQHFKIIK